MYQTRNSRQYNSLFVDRNVFLFVHCLMTLTLMVQGVWVDVEWCASSTAAEAAPWQTHWTGVRHQTSWVPDQRRLRQNISTYVWLLLAVYTTVASITLCIVRQSKPIL